MQYLGLKAIIKLKFLCIDLTLLIEFSISSEVYLGEPFALNKFSLCLSELKGVIILNKSSVAYWMSSYKNQEPLIKPLEVWDSASLNLPWGLIIQFIFDFVSINNFLFSSFWEGVISSIISNNLLKFVGAHDFESFWI